MSFDDDADEDAPGFRQPPHPDDRLWRHPSEMGAPDDAASARPGGAGLRALRGGHGWRKVAGGAAGVLIVVAGLAALIAGGGLSGGKADEQPGRSDASATAGARGSTDPEADQPAPAAVADAVAPALLGLEGGSGVVVRADGLALTSATLVDGGPGATVPARLPDGTSVEATVVGVDETTGLGVLDLPGDGHSAATLADVDGELSGAAYTIGMSEPPEGPAATAGVVGSSRKLSGTAGSDLDGVLEVEGGRADPAALGGPVVDRDGAVIGITTALGGERSSYLTPIDVGRKVAGDLQQWGHVQHSWLGIEGMDRVEGSGLHARGGHGAEVATVAGGGPADAAGVRAGDVIVGFDGQRIERMSDLIRWLRALPPGHSAEVTLERGGERVTVTAVLAQRNG